MHSCAALARIRAPFTHHGCRFFSAPNFNTETVSFLQNTSSGHSVYLVGTAHVSAQSAQDVADTIELARPNCIMVELCRPRADSLRSGKMSRPLDEIAQDFLKHIFGRNSGPNFGGEALLKLGLSSLYSLLRLYGLQPGQEFKVALEEADRRKLPLVYGDRNVDETVSRLRDALSSVSFSRFTSSVPDLPPELQKLFGSANIGNLSDRVEMLKNRRQVALFRDHMGTVAPEIMEVMVLQRDKIMVDKLLHESKPGCTVAVVGMAHMDGIEQEWQSRGGEVFLHGDNSLRRES